MPTNKKISRRTPNRASRTKLFRVVIHEVLVHEIHLDATTADGAIRLAVARWNDTGVDAFYTETLGRTDLVNASEVRS